MRLFYSWQLDLPANSHKDFIRNCLDEALNRINSEVNIEEAERPNIQLDHDTLNVPGTPDIVNTIFEKIDLSDIFVADLSFVAKTDNGRKRLPNANVLFESGYALRSLKSDRLLFILDKATAATQEPLFNQLPFDFRHRRVTLLFDSTISNKDAERERFIIELKNEIQVIVDFFGAPETPIQLQENPNYYDIVHTILESDSHDDWRTVYQEGATTIYLKTNVNLRFVLDYNKNVVKQNSIESWTENLPCPTASTYYTELYFNSTFIEKFALVFVDGSRATLPQPKLTNLTVTPMQYKVAQIHDPTREFHEYFHRTGLRIEKAPN